VDFWGFAGEVGLGFWVRLKVSLGGNLTIHCRIFIDDKLALSE
jgi:hypothetical protein